MGQGLRLHPVLSALRLFVLLALVAAASIVAKAEVFESEMKAIPVVLTLTPVFDAANYDYSFDIGTIQRLSTDTRSSIHESLTLGLTRYEPFMDFSVPVRKETNTVTGVTCMRLENAAAHFGYHNVTVLIAREIPYQSCGFNTVYGHEQKHIAVNWEVLQQYTPLIHDMLQDYLNKFGVICTHDPDDVDRKLNETFHTMLSQWNDQINAENRRRQQQVDSVEEYTRITNSCNGQLADIARQFLSHRL